MIRLLAALLAPLVVIAALLFGLPSHQGPHLQKVDSAQGEAPAALGAAVDQADAQAERQAVATARSHTSHTASRATRSTIRPAAATADSQAPETLPLQVTMDALSTAVVPQKRAVIVSGRVVNDSFDTWSDINVYACSSGTPITSAHDLRHAAEATTDDVVCGRTSVFVTIDELGPGDSATYRLKVPRDRLGIGTHPGAYWFGVQALGTSTDGRDAVADGTVRTFLPQVGTGDDRPAARSSFTVVLPFRGRTLHTSDGKLAAAADWRKSVAPGGRLANMLALAEDAPTDGAALLVDPAVIAAIQQIAAGNPERTLGTPTPKKGEESPSASASPAPETGDDDKDAPKPDAHAAAWLQQFTAVAQHLPVLALPYGDLDVAGAARHDSKALQRARQESDAVFSDLGLQATPVFAPPNGYLPAEAREVAGGAALIASSEALPAELAEGEEIPAEVTIGSQDVHVSEAGVAAGGPAPTPGTGALALRQRLLAEGLVRSGEASSTLVVLPWDADPGPDPSSFFAELDRPFVETTGTLPTSPDSVEVPDLVYPTSQHDREISRTQFATADHLTELGDTLDRLLAEDNGVATVATREALSDTSYLARDAQLAAAGLKGDARRSLEGATNWYADQLARVDVSVPNFVILGSTEGPFAMTVANGLERPIRLGIRATTSGGLDIRAPKSIKVPAGSSRTVNLVAHTTEPGVHTLVLVVTDAEGHPVRKSQDISIRSRDVGWVIWLIMGGGGALLFVAIVLRWRKRLRASRNGGAAAPAASAATTVVITDPADGTAHDPEAPEAP